MRDMVKASLKNYRQSARKVRLVADKVRGKRAVDAVTELSFIPKRASLPVQKLIQSAIANAEHNNNTKAENLVISEIRVNEGFTMKRFIPKARGMAHPIRKRTCSVDIVLVDATATADAKVEEKKAPAAKKETKEAAPAKKKATTAKKTTKKVTKEDKK
jgi:large subunit ribosomal protein L22